MMAGSVVTWKKLHRSKACCSARTKRIGLAGTRSAASSQGSHTPAMRFAPRHAFSPVGPASSTPRLSQPFAVTLPDRAFIFGPTDTPADTGIVANSPDDSSRSHVMRREGPRRAVRSPSNARPNYAASPGMFPAWCGHWMIRSRRDSPTRNCICIKCKTSPTAISSHPGQGKQGGRPGKLDRKAHARLERMLAAGKSQAECANLLGVSDRTVGRAVASM